MDQAFSQVNEDDEETSVLKYQVNEDDEFDNEVDDFEIEDGEKTSVLKYQVSDLLEIQLKILNIKKLQAKLFIEKVCEALEILETERTPNLPYQLIKEILPLALPVGDFVEGPGLQILRSNVKYIVPMRMRINEFETELPERVLEQIGLIENKLEKFLDETDLYSVWQDLRERLALVHSRGAVRDLIQATQELKEAINFFHEVGTESALLCEYLSFVNAPRRFWIELNKRKKRSHEFIKGIGDVVNKALDAVRCPLKDRLSAQMRAFEEDVLLVRLGSSFKSFRGSKVRRLRLRCNLSLCSKVRLLRNETEHVDEKVEVVENDAWLSSGFMNIKENCIEKQARNFFDGKNGVRLVLLDTLEKLHSIEGETNVIAEIRGKDWLQAWNPSFNNLIN